MHGRSVSRSSQPPQHLWRTEKEVGKNSETRSGHGAAIRLFYWSCCALVLGPAPSSRRFSQEEILENELAFRIGKRTAAVLSRPIVTTRRQRHDANLNRSCPCGLAGRRLTDVPEHLGRDGSSGPIV